MTRIKKLLGKWGENRVDASLASLGWRRIAANSRLKRGEIDRIYCKNGVDASADSPTFGNSEIERAGIVGLSAICSRVSQGREICLAEIKCHRVHRVHQFLELQAESGLVCDLKTRQLRNLYSLANEIHSWRAAHCRYQSSVYVRLFRVFVFSRQLGQVLLRKIPGYLVCGRVVAQGETFLISSLEPNFVPFGSRGNSLDVELPTH